MRVTQTTANRASGHRFFHLGCVVCLFILLGMSMLVCLAGSKSNYHEKGSSMQPEIGTVPYQTHCAVYIAQDKTVLRNMPDENSASVTVLNRGDMGTWLYNEGSWSKIEVPGNIGYVKKEQLSDKEVWPTLPNEFQNPCVLVHKSDRELLLYDGGKLYGRYPIGLGWNPLGRKEKEGDGKTPEGSYYVCYRNANSSFHLSLGLSYPNAEDAKYGLVSGLIDQKTYDQILQANINGERPPWNTPLGGEIMIHGSGSHRDWTAGCIAVDNDVMNILWQLCPIGTKIEIMP